MEDKIFYSLREFSINISNSRNLSDALKISLNSAIELSELDSGGIYILDAKTNALNLTVSQGLSRKFIEFANSYPAGSPNTDLVMCGKPFYIPYPSHRVIETLVRKHEMVRAIAIIPIISDLEIKGCLNVASHSLDEVPVYARIVLEIMAYQIGNVIARFTAESELHSQKNEFNNTNNQDSEK